MPNSWTYTKIEGLDELQRKLEQLPDKVAKKSLRSALTAGARIILSAFVAFAPRATGFLAAHFDLHLSIRGSDLAGSAYVGPQGKMDYPNASGGYKERVNSAGRKSKLGRIAVASVARFLEFGTSKFGAKPFMTPAWESHKEVARDAIISNLAEGIEEAAKD